MSVKVEQPVVTKLNDFTVHSFPSDPTGFWIKGSKKWLHYSEREGKVFINGKEIK
jgi:hypothetical protein